MTAALRMLALASPPIRVGLLASDHGLPDAAAALREIAALSPQAMQWIAIGRRPDASEIERLRGAGVHFALFDPFSDEELRFVVSEAHHAGSPEPLRIEQRVPTLIRARVTTKTGERVAVVCNLSTLGAYLATPRPAMRGGTAPGAIPLEDGEVETPGPRDVEQRPRQPAPAECRRSGWACASPRCRATPRPRWSATSWNARRPTGSEPA